MSLQSLRLENFRGFSDVSITTKPLTVLVGSNSSGKSSFSQALAVMAHANRLYANTPRLSLTPADDPETWPADLGYLADTRKTGAQGPIYVSVHTDAGVVRWGFGLDQAPERSRPLDITYISQTAPQSDEIQTVSTEKPAASTPVEMTGVIELAEGSITSQPNMQSFYKINEVQWKEDPGGIESVVDLRGLVLSIVSHPGGTAVHLNNIIQREIQTIFDNLIYLRAVRARPFRSYPTRYRSPQPIMGYAGEGFAEVLYERGKEAVRYFRPPEEVKNSRGNHEFLLSRWTTHEATLTEAVAEWLRYLGLATAVEARPHPNDPRSLQIRVTVGAGTPHDISEVGFGLSQILPVIIAGLGQSANGTFVVDLPEAHLHPRSEALLGDFFCALALGKKHCIVETHSEMFVNQLRLRAEMDETLRENIAIYFLDEPKAGDCEPPILVGLDEEDQLRWPKGFMEEAWEIEVKINAIRIARQF
jgi:predicted ATPase